MLIVTLASLVGTVCALHRHPEGLLPDRGYRFHHRTTEAATDISFEAMMARAAARSPRSSAPDPAVDYINLTVGAGGPNPTNNNGRLFIALKPRERAQRRARRR